VTRPRGRPRKEIILGIANAQEIAEEDLRELPKVLLELEVPRFLRAAETVDDLIAVSLMLFSALRVGEVEELLVGDLDLEKGELKVRAEVAKRSKERRVPIDARTVALLSARVAEAGRSAADYVYPRSEGLAPRSVARNLQNKVRAMAVEAGVTRLDVSPHTLRHTGITMMLERKMAVEVVRAIAGHEDIATTMIYTHLSTRHIIRTFQEAYGI
jgi:integrase/recombinase XerD